MEKRLHEQEQQKIRLEMHLAEEEAKAEEVNIFLCNLIWLESYSWQTLISKTLLRIFLAEYYGSYRFAAVNDNSEV